VICAAAFSEEAPKPENTTDGTKSAEAQEGESVTTAQSKSKKSTKEAQTVMTNIESLYFADTYLFQGLSRGHTQSIVMLQEYFLIITMHECLLLYFCLTNAH